MDRPCPSAIVLIARFEHGQVEMMFDQFIQCVFKGTRLELRLERKRNKNHLIVLVWFVSGHVFLQTALRSASIPLFRQFQRFALYPFGVLVGGRRQRRFNGTNFKPRKLLENAQTPTSVAVAPWRHRVHAVLACVIVGLVSPDAHFLKQICTTHLHLQHLALHLAQEK